MSRSFRDEDDDKNGTGGWAICIGISAVCGCIIGITALVIGSIALAKYNGLPASPPTEAPNVGPAAILQQHNLGNVAVLSQAQPRGQQQLAALLKNKRAIEEEEEDEEIPPLLEAAPLVANKKVPLVNKKAPVLNAKAV